MKLRGTENVWWYDSEAKYPDRSSARHRKEAVAMRCVASCCVALCCVASRSAVALHCLALSSCCVVGGGEGWMMNLMKLELGSPWLTRGALDRQI